MTPRRILTSVLFFAAVCGASSAVLADEAALPQREREACRHALARVEAGDPALKGTLVGQCENNRRSLDYWKCVEGELDARHSFKSASDKCTSSHP
jgi:hypothetical protein